jgi:DNA polymerase delta subunit 4
MKRWKRADMLGLNPPIEVLAALLKEEEVENKKAQRPHIEKLMTSRLVEEP